MDQVDAAEKLKLKHLVKELATYKARHTEQISVYVPVGYDLIKVINHLQEEAGTAMNIKSATTRKNVITALEKMIQHLKVIGRTPKNGLAVFSGNVSEYEGKQDFKVWSVEPPLPLNVRIYRCEKTFILDSLENMLENKNIYGLVVMDRREATFGLLKGKTISVLDNITSNVPGKTRAGGQSAARFSRLREEAAKEFMKKVAEYMKREYLPLIVEKKLKGIFLGGPGLTKNDLVNRNYITRQIADKILAIKDIVYTDESGLYELLDLCRDLIVEENFAEEKKRGKNYGRSNKEIPR